jgi:hypothetical protein
MPEGDLAGLRDRLVADVQTLVSKRPRLRIELLCDGSPEMWNLLEAGFTPEKFGDRPHELIDLDHVVEKLAPAAQVLDGETAAKKTWAVGRWRCSIGSTRRRPSSPSWRCPAKST